MSVSAPGIGTIIDDRYRLKREIARGGMGVVYEAENLTDTTAVAIKLLSYEHAHTAEARQRLLREGEALQRGEHPGVVSALAFGESEHGPFLVMELLEGRPLDGILTVRRKICVSDAVFIGGQLCAALGVVHQRGLVHRDIKPGNVFIARDARGDEVAKLFDFGIANVGPSFPKLTRYGSVLGTPEYMAPEQLLAHEDIDHRCDIYALGVTMYECLTGAVPFEGNFGEVLLKSATQPVPPLRDRCPEASVELARVIEKALAREPGQRFADAPSFGDALRGASPYPARPSLLLGRRLDLTAREATRGVFPTAVAASALVDVPVRRADQLLGGGPTAPPPDGAYGSLRRAVDQKTLTTGWTTAAPVPSLPTREPPRRRFARAAYVTYVSIVLHDGSTLDARSEDISVGGMLILPKTACLEEDIRAVSFALPMTGRIVELAAVARWVKAARVKQAMGIQFSTMPDDVFASIERYVQVMGSDES